jgi:hypothetical protein
MRNPEFLAQDTLEVGLVHQLACELRHDVAVALERFVELLHVVDLRHGFRDGGLAYVVDVLLVRLLDTVHNVKICLILL